MIREDKKSNGMRLLQQLLILVLLILLVACASNRSDEKKVKLKHEIFQQQTSSYPYDGTLSDAIPEPSTPKIIRQVIKPQSYPTKVALLLPLDGELAPAAESIKTGFLLGYFNNDFVKRPIVKIYNSNQDLKLLYNQIVMDQMDFIVGPLDKTTVTRFLKISSGDIPILTLNYSEREHNNEKRHFEYGLLPEDEVKQIAELAYSKGFKHAAIITKDDIWGKRMASAFQSTWHALGDEEYKIIEALEIENPSFASQNIAKLLGVDQSNERTKLLKKFISHKITHVPRVRKDIDVIFIAMQPNLARQVVPLIAFHYGQNIPIVATSHIYPTAFDKEELADLNNTLFCDIPWVLSPKPELVNKMPELFQKDANNRLFALGYDAFNMIPYLMKQIKGELFMFYGETGMLTVTEGNRIKRRLPFAKIDKEMVHIL